MAMSVPSCCSHGHCLTHLGTSCPQQDTCIFCSSVSRTPVGPPQRLDGRMAGYNGRQDSLKKLHLWSAGPWCLSAGGGGNGWTRPGHEHMGSGDNQGPHRSSAHCLLRQKAPGPHTTVPEAQVRQGHFDPAEERPGPVPRVLVVQDLTLPSPAPCWGQIRDAGPYAHCLSRGWESPGLCGAITSQCV